ncbi:MAG: immunoglobulin domain-containing protein, partial [Verrucomicrobiia bacterium]
MRKAALAIIMAIALRTANVLSQAVIAQWNFNAESIEPSLGNGTATLLGSVTSTFASGSAGDSGGTSNRALSIAGFPSQGKAARTAGVQFAVDTTGYENIVVWWDQRFSSTASRRAIFQMSADGETFYDAFTFDAPGEGWTNKVTIDLGNYPGLSNNPLFAFRIVSDFYENDAYAPAKPDSAYSSAGTWRFDRVTITGSAMGASIEPPAILTQSADLTLPAGAEAVFSVTASGSEPLHYQWWFGDSIVLGGTNNTLQIPSVGKTNEGIYRVVVSNWIGSVTSAPASL